MIKYIWLTAGILIVFCLIENLQARTATISSYQHLNGFTVNAPVSGEDDEAQHRQQTQSQQQQATSEKDNAIEENDAWFSNSAASGIWKDLSLVYRMYQQCSSENLSVCLKVKLLTGLEKVLRTSKTISLVDGVQFVRSDRSDNANLDVNIKLPSESDIAATLPRSLEAKEHILNNLIFKKISSFLRDHTLQVKFPNIYASDSISSNSIDGRGKKDKKGGYIMIPLLLGGTFIPLAYGALAMLAGKALIVSKLALVLASIIGIKKLLSGGGGKESHEVVVSSGSHSGWGRDFDLAYSGWKPAKDADKVL